MCTICGNELSILSSGASILMLQFLQCNYSAIDEFRWIFLEDVNWKYICDRSLWYHNWQLMGISSDRLKETFSVLFICKRDTPWSRTHAHLHLDWVRKYKTCGNGVFIARFHKYNFELINDAPSSENMNHRNEFQKETKMSEVLVYLWVGMKLSDFRSQDHSSRARFITEFLHFTCR